MINLDTQELQAKCINKILIQNMDKLSEKYLKNKLTYLLWFDDEMIVSYMYRINVIYKTIDLALESNNYKRALRYTCLLDKYINEVVVLVENKATEIILL